MPLPLPTLDDRTYQQLLDEVLERLPATAPEWTDYNASDPGITLLELFAYLSETLFYRLDRIPERHYRAFLRLIGCAPRPAQVAQTLVAFRAAQPTGVELPASVQIANDSGDIVFQTDTPFHVAGARLTAVVTATPGRFEDHSDSITDMTATFLALGANPKPDDALYLGFDTQPGARARGPARRGEGRVRLFVIGENPVADLRTWQALREEWRREMARFRGSCPRLPGGLGRFWQHYGTRTTWEYYSNARDWKPLPLLKDCTRALSLSGPVRWQAPDLDTHTPGGIPGYEKKYFIRCRLVEGVYDCPPRIRGVRVNAVLARHAADVADPFPFDKSTGRAGQSFHLPQTPVVPGSTQLLVIAKGKSQPGWMERLDFDQSGPHAKHYVLTPDRGEIAFGDGRAGRVPDTESTLTASWKVGGGASGNVPSGTLKALPSKGANERIAEWSTIRDGLAVEKAIEQPVDACGGAEAEPIDEAKARAYRMVAQERCAVTLEDLERVALSAPGVPVARAHAVAEFHPDLTCLRAAGCVTVVIVPQCADRNPNPTAAMCRAVERLIWHRRPVTLEIHVTGPQYTVVTANAKLALARGADRNALVAQARDALRQFLSPLSGGGPGGKGWPVGRSIYRSEILALLGGIAGVQYVADLTLTADENTPAHCGDIALCPNGLPISGQHQISAQRRSLP